MLAKEGSLSGVYCNPVSILGCQFSIHEYLFVYNYAIAVTYLSCFINHLLYEQIHKFAKIQHIPPLNKCPPSP